MGRKQLDQSMIVAADHESLNDSLVNGHSGWSPTTSPKKPDFVVGSANMREVSHMSDMTLSNYSGLLSNRKDYVRNDSDCWVQEPQKVVTCEDNNKRNTEIMLGSMSRDCVSDVQKCDTTKTRDVTSVKEKMFRTCLEVDEIIRKASGLKIDSHEEGMSVDLRAWHYYRDAENERRRSTFNIDNLEQCQDNSLPLICYSSEFETGVKNVFGQDESCADEKGSQEAVSTEKEQKTPPADEHRDNEDPQITRAGMKWQDVTAFAGTPFHSSSELKLKRHQVKPSDEKPRSKLSSKHLQILGGRRYIPCFNGRQQHGDDSIWLMCRRAVRGRRNVAVDDFNCLATRSPAGRQCPGGSSQGNGQRHYYSRYSDGGGGCGATGGFDRSGSNSMPNGGSGGQGGDEDDEHGRLENFFKNFGKRKSEEDQKQKSKKNLEAGILDWLMSGDGAEFPFTDVEKSIFLKCVAMCLKKSNGHSNCSINCSICNALILQLKHCSRKCNEDESDCSICSRVFHIVTEFSRFQRPVASCDREGQGSGDCSLGAAGGCSLPPLVASHRQNEFCIPGADLREGASLSDVRSLLQSVLHFNIADDDSDKDNYDDEDDDISDRDVPDDSDKENSESKAATAAHESATEIERGAELIAELSGSFPFARRSLSRSSSEKSIVMPSFEDEQDELPPLPEHTDRQQQMWYGGPSHLPMIASMSGTTATSLAGVSSALTGGKQSDLSLSVPTPVSNRNVYQTDGHPTSLPAALNTDRAEHSSLPFLRQAISSPPASAACGSSSLGTLSGVAWNTSVAASRVDSTAARGASASSINSFSPLNPPRVYMSEAFPGGAANLLGGSAIRSMPSEGRRHGQISYGSKGDLRRMAHLWHNCAERARRDATANMHRLPVAGIILNSARMIMCIVNGNYDEDYEWTSVSEPLGCGVAGKCHAAYDFERSASFCVKKIHLLNFSADELVVWSNLEHPDVVELYGAMLFNDQVFIFQELIQGPTLREWISTNTALDSYIALQLLQNLLQILKYLKSRRVIHDDIKADNLMLRRSSLRVVVIDFGLSRNTDFVPADVDPTGGQTHWSPEKAASEGYDFGADLWAAVAVFVHMLSGNEPWIVRFKQAGFLHYIIKLFSPPLDDIPAGIPNVIRDLICRGWTVNTDERPTVEQLLSHEAFVLLDTMQQDSELFRRHLPATSSDMSATFSASVQWDADELETETLISRAEELSVHLRSAAIFFNEESLEPAGELQEAVAAFIDIQHPEQSIGNNAAAVTASNELRELLNEAEQSMSLLRIASESILMEARQRKVTFRMESESSGTSDEESSGSEGEDGKDEEEVTADPRHESVGFVASVALTDLRCEDAGGRAVLRLSQSQLEEISREFSRRQVSMPEKRSTNDVVPLSSQASAPAMLEPSCAEPLSLQELQRSRDSNPFTSMPCPRWEIPAVFPPTFPENSSPLTIEPAAGAFELPDVERQEWRHLGARPKIFPVPQHNPEPPTPPRSDISMGSSAGLIPTSVWEMSVSDDEDTQDSQSEVVCNASTESCIEATLTPEAFMAAVLPGCQPPAIPEPSSDLSLTSVPENTGATSTLHGELQRQFPYSVSDTSLLMSSSIGTTVTVYHENTVVYRAHLHPGPEHLWSEVLRRASGKIHQSGVVEFTAELVHTNCPSVPIDVDMEVPQEGHVAVNLLPVLGDWVWKIEDSRICNHPSYHGQFGPRMDD